MTEDERQDAAAACLARIQALYDALPADAPGGKYSPHNEAGYAEIMAETIIYRQLTGRSPLADLARKKESE